MKRFLCGMWRVVGALGFVVLGLPACGGGGGASGPDDLGDAVAPPDGGDTAEAGEAQAGDTATPTLALTYAFTGDGQSVRATFSAALDTASVAPAAFEVECTGGAAAPGVATATVADLEVALELDAALPAAADCHLVATGVRDSAGLPLDPAGARTLIRGTLFLAMVWHQHQPVYIDPEGDYLRGPWVRKHATKDYYDMAAMLQDHPDIHVMVNLTPVLLRQLQQYYVDRLAPFVDVEAGTIDTAGYFAQRGPGAVTTPITDPWLDMLLSPTPEPAALTEEQRGWFMTDIWSNFSISDVMLGRFLEYRNLRDKRDRFPEIISQDDLLQMKGWFELAWFDPDFLRGPVVLPDGHVVDLSDLVSEDAEGRFLLKQPFTEAICQRLVVEDFKVMSNVVAIHRDLRYDAALRTGQIEVMTTPFYHPILPLLFDSDLALQGMPDTALPVQRFAQPADADYHVAKAVQLYGELFGRNQVTGMWPAEGSVAEAVVPIFVENGVRWIATDRRVLERSLPDGADVYTPYRIDADTEPGSAGRSDDELAIVFRDTELSDKIGFHYQGGLPEDNVADFVATLRRHAPGYGHDRLLTVILDGENAWEWYQLDNDGKGFLHALYTMLENAQQNGEFRTATVSEYLSGNEARHIPAHPLSNLPELEPLFAGSWIGGTFSTWIGEEEENQAWDYLASVRADMAQFEAAGLSRPDLNQPPPEAGSAAYYAAQAWESLFAAEGSDWFWWYGSDQTAVGGDQPFDRIFRELLRSVYRNVGLAGIPVEVPEFPPVLRRCEAPTAAFPDAPPVVDGRFEPDDGGDALAPSEWTLAGSGICMDPDSASAVPEPADDIAIYYYGYTADALYVALRMNDDLQPKDGTDYQVRFYFSQKHLLSVEDETFEQDPLLAATRAGEPLTMKAGGAAYEVTIDFASGQALLATPDGATWGPAVATPDIQIAGGGADGPHTLEMRVPFSSIHYQSGDPLEAVITAVDAGVEFDRAPNANSLVVFVDRSRLVEVTFVLDATGDRVALDAVSTINNPPPPAGTGTVFIVGNLAELGNWTPNQVAMADDGTSFGDAQANDNRWTFRLLVAPMADVQYKYTIGSAGESWVATEEFPLTNRGFLATDRNDDRKMVVEDVFADRPDPSGSLAPMTTVSND